MAGGFELVVRAPRMVTAAGETAACVAVRDGRVAAVEPLAAGLSGRRTVTLADGGLLAGAELDRLVASRPLASLDALPRPLAARLAG